MLQKLEQNISASLASFTLATPCLANPFMRQPWNLALAFGCRWKRQCLPKKYFSICSAQKTTRLIKWSAACSKNTTAPKGTPEKKSNLQLKICSPSKSEPTNVCLDGTYIEPFTLATPAGSPLMWQPGTRWTNTMLPKRKPCPAQWFQNGTLSTLQIYAPKMDCCQLQESSFQVAAPLAWIFL